MTLIVGLGNPGGKYENTRHNAGFMVIDRLLSPQAIKISNEKFQGELYKMGSLLLLKPQTFMNLSGKSVQAVANFYKPERIIVIHDDLDLAFGAMKFKIGGSSGGHNGIKSIDSLIGNEYERVRIGIGRGKFDTINFVLGKFSEDEREILDETLNYAKNAVEFLIKNDIDETARKFNRRNSPKALNLDISKDTNAKPKNSAHKNLDTKSSVNFLNSNPNLDDKIDVSCAKQSEISNINLRTNKEIPNSKSNSANFSEIIATKAPNQKGD